MNSVAIKRKYLLDTNVLIELSLWIPISLNKVFWSMLEKALQAGDWVLLDVVVGEIKYNDELIKWCKSQNGKGLVKSLDIKNRERAIEINNAYKMIDDITQNSTVDTYLVAYAEANNLVLFSRESERDNGTKLYKIPDVCKILKINFIRKPRVFLGAIDFKN